MDWSLYPNFRKEELACKHTGDCLMHPLMMEKLQDIRNELQQPIFLSSGYRSRKHPIEMTKDKPGEHTLGLAVDIICHGKRALDILKLAQKHDVTRIGIHQKGNVNGRYIHLGLADKKYGLDYPSAIWTY